MIAECADPTTWPDAAMVAAFCFSMFGMVWVTMRGGDR